MPERHHRQREQTLRVLSMIYDRHKHDGTDIERLNLDNKRGWLMEREGIARWEKKAKYLTIMEETRATTDTGI